MSYAFRCDVTGLVEWCDTAGKQSCPYCHGQHETYVCGAPPKEEGAPAVHGDELNSYWDWSAGCKIESKSQRRRVYAEKGLEERSASEHYRKYGEPVGVTKGTTFSYAGQTNRSTSSEHVRTKDGRRVI
jgi:hypothetical protein